ncbi:MAG: hypothetical protein M3471_00250 [Actinomycetota bacterium]|nr:hypothetical protein [Actinomycetota bacterium]
MRGLTRVESGKDRKTFARDAGMGSISFLSILAGTLVAFASFAVLLTIVGGILAAVGIDTATLTANDYERLGIGSAVVAALVLFLSYFFGGYIAGRLARRAGALNGGLVLVLAIVIGAVVALLVGTQTETENVAANLRVIGVPTSGADFGTIATVAGIVTLVAMIAGAVLGGIKGERWHGKLAARAWSPNVGPPAVAHREEDEAEQRQREREQQEHQRQQEQARRPWDTTGSTPATEPAYQGGQPPVDAGPTTSGDWDQSETRTWGASPDGGPTPVADPDGDRGSSGPQDRPRRERPLRSGGRG